MSATLPPETQETPTDSAGPRSRALFDRARSVIPGGVNSPVRAYRAVGGTPLFLAKGEGAHFEDADGRRYLDFVCSWGPLILGHAHPEVLQAVTRAAARGMTFGAPCSGEIDLAEAVVARYPGLEQVRFVSSGTEATMSAIRLARGATGRDLIVKFAGCYHGHADHLLVSAGSGLVTFGRPSSAGVPAAFAELTRVLPLDDEAALDALFAAEGDRIATVIVEPVPANNGLLLQRLEFLRQLRAVTARAGAVLIFDEVISGFRVARGGAAELFGLTPDLATVGKILGGGMPVGAFGGRRDIMEKIAPLGSVYQAGTLSGSPVAVAAGLATLKRVSQPGFYAQLAKKTQRLMDGLQAEAKRHGVTFSAQAVGGMFGLYFRAAPPTSYAEVMECDKEAFNRFFHAMLEKGVYFAPSAFEAGFVSAAHAEADLAATCAAAGEVFSRFRL